MKTRDVYIVHNLKAKSFFVMYVKRNCRQWHYAAGFDESIKTYDEVVQWVKGNPRLTLIEGVKP